MHGDERGKPGEHEQHDDQERKTYDFHIRLMHVVIIPQQRKKAIKSRAQSVAFCSNVWCSARLSEAGAYRKKAALNA
jgi:hypothetical protein